MGKSAPVRVGLRQDANVELRGCVSSGPRMPKSAVVSTLNGQVGPRMCWPVAGRNCGGERLCEVRASNAQVSCCKCQPRSRTLLCRWETWEDVVQACLCSKGAGLEAGQVCVGGGASGETLKGLLKSCTGEGRALYG